MAIHSQNQGKKITPKTSSNQHIAISDEYQVGDKAVILMEDLVEGYNAQYKIECSYQDVDGQVLDCTEEVIEDQSRSIPYYFYIEFVTRDRHVIH